MSTLIGTFQALPYGPLFDLIPLAIHFLRALTFLGITDNYYFWFSSNICECSFSYFFIFFSHSAPSLGRMLQCTTQITLQELSTISPAVGRTARSWPLAANSLQILPLLQTTALPEATPQQRRAYNQTLISTGALRPLNLKSRELFQHSGFADNSEGTVMLLSFALSNYAPFPFLLQV